MILSEYTFLSLISLIKVYGCKDRGFIVQCGEKCYINFRLGLLFYAKACSDSTCGFRPGILVCLISFSRNDCLLGLKCSFLRNFLHKVLFYVQYCCTFAPRKQLKKI